MILVSSKCLQKGTEKKSENDLMCFGVPHYNATGNRTCPNLTDRDANAIRDAMRGLDGFGADTSTGGTSAAGVTSTGGASGASA